MDDKRKAKIYARLPVEDLVDLLVAAEAGVKGLLDEKSRRSIYAKLPAKDLVKLLLNAERNREDARRTPARFDALPSYWPRRQPGPYEVVPASLQEFINSGGTMTSAGKHYVN